ncbi:hypothetical protein Tco_1523276, partial [Tanacetum coccineum]
TVNILWCNISSALKLSEAAMLVLNVLCQPITILDPVSVVQQSESVTLSPESVPLEAVSIVCGLLPATLHSQSGVMRP